MSGVGEPWPEQHSHRVLVRLGAKNALRLGTGTANLDSADQN